MTAIATEPAFGSLQALLVAVRKRLTPEELGVPRGPRQQEGDGVTQEQVARKLGISLRHYSAVETGEKDPSLLLLRALARKLPLDTRERLAMVDAVL